MRAPTNSTLAPWRRHLAPGICLLCHQRSGIAFDLCRACLRSLPTNTAACRFCALPLAQSDDAGHHLPCAGCAATPPIWDRAFAAFSYAAPVNTMIHRIKYGGSLVDARVLAGLLADRVATEYAEGDIPGLMTPIPLSWRRLVRRGHNQAALIARYVGQRLNISVHYDVLRRTRHTPPQAQLSRSARRANLSRAFRLRGALPAPRITLIDDVLTTGATLRAAARTLKAAGAAEVHVWVLARTHE